MILTGHMPIYVLLKNIFLFINLFFIVSD